jgi:hypothetical protein
MHFISKTFYSIRLPHLLICQIYAFLAEIQLAGLLSGTSDNLIVFSENDVVFPLVIEVRTRRGGSGRTSIQPHFGEFNI